jgi:hypothetical protein
VSDRLEATEAPAVRLYTDAELRSLPAPRWLIDDILPAGGFGMLYGQPETGKSFLAIDWSLCVATGLPWRGHRTRMGGVVYVAAGEGVSGLSQRIDAWKFVHGVDDLPAALFHIQAVNLLDLSDVARFLYAVQMRIATDPELIVLDTLHRCTPGADENSSQDAGRAIAGIDLIRRELDTAVLVLHHSGKNGESERGSSAYWGAVDTKMALKSNDGGLVLECQKQKDGPHFDDIRLSLQPVPGHNSLVIASPETAPNPDRLTRNQIKMLEALRDTDVGIGVSAKEWEVSSAVPAGSFMRVRKQLVDFGYVVGGSKSRYRLSPTGEARLVSLSGRYHGGITIPARGINHSHTPLGVRSDTRGAA